MGKLCTKGRIGKICEAEDRTDWKSRVKKVIARPQMSYFPLKINSRAKKKKCHQVRKCPIFHSKSVGSKVYISVSVRGPHYNLADRMRPTSRSLPTPELKKQTNNYMLMISIVLVTCKTKFKSFLLRFL